MYNARNERSRRNPSCIKFRSSEIDARLYQRFSHQEDHQQIHRNVIMQSFGTAPSINPVDQDDHNSIPIRPAEQGKRRWILNAFDMSCAGHQSPGLWKHEDDWSARYHDIE